MKIFNRGTDAKPAGPAAAVAAAPAPAPAPVAAPPPAAAPAAAPAPAAPAAPPAPDLSVILDANVREMSEKIARLASSIEGQQQERGSFEAKLEQMEERMRKLSSLTEMISAQYNPFVGDAPTEREALPAPEVGLAPPPAATATLMPPMPGRVEAAPPMSLTLDAPPLVPPVVTLDPMASVPAASAAPALDLPPFDPEQAAMAPFMEAEPAPLAAPAAAPAFAASAQPAPAPADDMTHGVHVWSVPAGFEGSMLLLGWADMLLKNAGSRESLLELVDYYHNIGWIGDPARDQLLAYADGIALPPASDVSGDWRANVEVHEKSLLFVEKLRAVSRRRE